MLKSDINNIITEGQTLRDALEKLDLLSGKEMTLIVVRDADDRTVTGTLTSGDIRRAMLGGATLQSHVADAMFRNFRRVYADSTDRVDVVRDARRCGITLLPVVDRKGTLVDILDLKVTPSSLPLTAIIMAGGKGERLRPMTDNTPKPLLKIGGKAIIDYNIEALAAAGITDITVTTRHLSEMIFKHFEQPVAGVKVRCVQELKPMGTIGSATLVKRPDTGDTLIMNSDLLTTVSFEDMYLKHRDTGASITVGVIPYQVSVPYAILNTNGDSVTDIEEKPSYSHYANAGIYIFSNETLNSLRPDTRADAPDVIRQAINEGKQVSYYVINGTWIDIGTPTDFRQATELMRHHKNMVSSTK